jgi:hypothetical protein
MTMNDNNSQHLNLPPKPLTSKGNGRDKNYTAQIKGRESCLLLRLGLPTW